jgi:hypothetical protein
MQDLCHGVVLLPLPGLAVYASVLMVNMFVRQLLRQKEANNLP